MMSPPKSRRRSSSAALIRFLPRDARVSDVAGRIADGPRRSGPAAPPAPSVRRDGGSLPDTGPAGRQPRSPFDRPERSRGSGYGVVVTQTRPDAIDTVVLDIDGTLVDSVYAHVWAWREAFRVLGLDVPTWKIH